MAAAFEVMTRSILSLIGAVLTTVSAILFLSLFAIEVTGSDLGPYMGIVAFLILPGIFVTGLVLIPLGIWRQRRREREMAASGQAMPRAPVIDFNKPQVRTTAFVVAVLSVANLAILAAGTYKGLEVMDSTEFCGGACHTVMNPEHATYSRSPHARVKCTECHIGEGAGWFVKSKLSGSWQLISVAFDLYPRPIPTPVHNLRPARETCEQCHWPEKFVGERLKVITRFEADEEQTEKKTVLLLKVGSGAGGKGHGIHWHVDPGNQVRYQSDEKRQTIFDIELTEADGTKKLFKAPGPPAEGQKVAEGWRTMDCIDCHNRPTHIYQRPEDELDRSLQAELLDRSLPFVKREGLRIVKETYASHEEARGGIRNALVAFYEKEYPEVAKESGPKVEKAAEELWNIYRRNVFPTMKIEWGTYPNFIFDSSGCFRCHDSKHITEKGDKLSKRCDLCHEVLADKEEDPEILQIMHP